MRIINCKNSRTHEQARKSIAAKAREWLDDRYLPRGTFQVVAYLRIRTLARP